MAPETGTRAAGTLRILIATAFGCGRSPLAPGTVGSLPGLAMAWGLSTLGGPWAVAAALVVVAVVGTWAAEGAVAHFQDSDPRQVVVDEVAGQMMTLLFVVPTPRTLVAGFLLFRVFDILKPYPAGALERLPGGTGVMADDLAAGIYANLVLHALIRFAPGLVGTA